LYSYPDLELPPANLRLKTEGGLDYVFDPCRKKYVRLSPEEWVRQHFLSFLIKHQAYPATLIRTEGGTRVNRLSKRTDLVVYDRTGDPWMLVECKASTVHITQTTLQQIAMYNKTIRAPYLVLTNGLRHHCMHIDEGEARLVHLQALPLWPA